MDLVRTVNPPSWRIEKKFQLKTDLIASPILDAACQPDPEYPENWVHTVHFDTPDLEAYHECLDGGFRKKKAIIRWYSDKPASLPNESCGPEFKMRCGGATGKCMGKKFRLELTTPKDVGAFYGWHGCAVEWFQFRVR